MFFSSKFPSKGIIKYWIAISVSKGSTINTCIGYLTTANTFATPATTVCNSFEGCMQFFLPHHAVGYLAGTWQIQRLASIEPWLAIRVINTPLGVINQRCTDCQLYLVMGHNNLREYQVIWPCNLSVSRWNHFRQTISHSKWVIKPMLFYRGNYLKWKYVKIFIWNVSKAHFE